MAATVPERHPLRRFFAALTEHTFFQRLGFSDPKVTDYIADLLCRFIHVDNIWRLRSAEGQVLEEVADMLAESLEPMRTVRSTREIHRHIGDFTLFWTGAYPEALQYLRGPLRKDHLIDYHEQGKRAYWVASQYDDEPYREEASVLRRLSEHFELCAFGLNQVRHEWEKPERWAAGPDEPRLIT